MKSKGFFAICKLELNDRVRIIGNNEDVFIVDDIYQINSVKHGTSEFVIQIADIDGFPIGKVSQDLLELIK